MRRRPQTVDRPLRLHLYRINNARLFQNSRIHGDQQLRTTSGQIRDAETKTITFENDGLIRTFIKVSSLFWFGSKRIRAWSLSIGFCTCLFACMIASVVANQWNKFFFDALQQQNAYALRIAIIYIVFLCILTSLFSLALLQLRMHLQLQWRIWLTEFLVTGWLRTLGHQLTNASRCVDNPEARIGDDARLSVELAVDLTGGIINTILLSTSFIFVLWHVGGTLHFANVSIPGYLVFVVIIYSSLTSFGMYCLAMPLVEKVEEKASAEGAFASNLHQPEAFRSSLCVRNPTPPKDRFFACHLASLHSNGLL